MLGFTGDGKVSDQICDTDLAAWMYCLQKLASVHSSKRIWCSLDNSSNALVFRSNLSSSAPASKGNFGLIAADLITLFEYGDTRRHERRY